MAGSKIAAFLLAFACSVAPHFADARPTATDSRGPSPRQATPTADDALSDALLRAQDRPGWRTEVLADGRVVAIGVRSDGAGLQAVGVACGARGQPEILAGARGRATTPQALLVEEEDNVWAFPIGRKGAAASRADALITDLMFTDDRPIAMWLDDLPLQPGGARIALQEVARDCASRYGWRYGDDDEAQMTWSLSTPPGRAARLVYGKPWTGWELVEFACDPGKGRVLVKATNVPAKAKSGQSFRLVVEVGAEKFVLKSRAELFPAGDISGFLVAGVGRPQPLLRALAGSERIEFRAASEKLTAPTGGAAALLSRLERICALR